MLFITNRVLQQGNASPPPGITREIDFHLQDNNALQSIFFCERESVGKYHEIGSQTFLDRLATTQAEQILLLVHGFANLPEDAIFQRAEKLQSLFDGRRKKLVEVVPIVWPCRSSNFSPDPRVVGDYFTDQQAADASGHAFSRALMRLLDWQSKNIDAGIPCLKRVNLLAHSMGNRVLLESFRLLCESLLRQNPPMLLRHTFLVAADVVNESLESGHPGQYVSFASASVTTYYSSSDMALRASKVTNVANRIASRRLGHTGPEDLAQVPHNVFAVDCGAFSNDYDPFGHTYFLSVDDKKPKAAPGECFKHIADTIESGVVPQVALQDPRLVRLAKSIVAGRRAVKKKGT